MSLDGTVSSLTSSSSSHSSSPRGAVMSLDATIDASPCPGPTHRCRPPSLSKSFDSAADVARRCDEQRRVRPAPLTRSSSLCADGVDVFEADNSNRPLSRCTAAAAVDDTGSDTELDRRPEPRRWASRLSAASRTSATAEAGQRRTDDRREESRRRRLTRRPSILSLMTDSSSGLRLDMDDTISQRCVVTCGPTRRQSAAVGGVDTAARCVTVSCDSKTAGVGADIVDSSRSNDDDRLDSDQPDNCNTNLYTIKITNTQSKF